jgi:hypothetical protein
LGRLPHFNPKPAPLLSSGRHPVCELHATGSRLERNAKTFDKRWVCREPDINLNRYA